jgi:SAM-dependent methyltransferase
MSEVLFSEAVVRDVLDFNRTPAWCTELLVTELKRRGIEPKTILDAGCGDGAIGKVLRQAWPKADLFGVEIDRTRKKAAQLAIPYSYTLCADWLGDMNLVTPDLIISNPPFGLAALDFLVCALRRVRPGGTVAFLLPTHWDHDVDANCGPDAPKTKDEALNRERRAHEQYARQRFLDSIRLPDGREGYCKLAIVGGGPNPCRPAFRGGANSATDRYDWYMFGEPWAGESGRRLHAIPPKVESGQMGMVMG